MDPAPRTAEPDLADQAADAVINLVDTVRSKTTGPVLTVARALVYGLIGLFAGLVAAILLAIALVRAIDAYLPGEVWSAHLLVGAVFTVAGFLVWTKRNGAGAA